MARFQISLNVADVDESVEFYRRLLGVEPAKHEIGYANFVVADPPLKLIVIEGEGAPGTLNHVKAPPEFDSSAAIQFPRTACAHEVVMPHEGQRVPNSQTNVHGGKPSCWCVPSPFGFGRKQQATTKGASQHPPARANKSRRRTENRSGRIWTL